MDGAGGIPDVWLDLPCVSRRRGAAAVDASFCLRVVCFSLPLRRVIVVARSHPVLATGPCWHSFSQRHVTASLHNSEARVAFRASHWPRAAEARPKRSALIGRRSINSALPCVDGGISTPRGFRRFYPPTTQATVWPGGGVHRGWTK